MKGTMIAAIDIEHDHRRGGADAHLVAGEGVGVHEGRRQLGRRARAAAGQGDDQVVGLDRHVREHHEGRHEGGPELRDDDPAVEREGRRAVDLRRLHHLVVDAAQAGEEHRHHEARRLPDRGDDDGVDRHVAVLDPLEGEALPAPAAHHRLQPDARVEEPLPGGAGDDEARAPSGRGRSVRMKPSARIFWSSRIASSSPSAQQITM